MAKFKIRHITKYNYEVPVRDSANQIMLYPITDEYQEITLHTISVTGNPVIEVHHDIFENKIGTFTHPLPHQELPRGRVEGRVGDPGRRGEAGQAENDIHRLA